MNVIKLKEQKYSMGQIRQKYGKEKTKNINLGKNEKKASMKINDHRQKAKSGTMIWIENWENRSKKIGERGQKR